MAHLLRPTFTKSIYQYYIQKGNSINVFGEVGLGKDRLLEDLKYLIMKNDENTHFIQLNMRDLRTDYSKFIKRLEEMLNTNDGFDRVELVLEKFLKKKGKKVLVLEQFESLFELNHDQNFDFDFFE